MDKLGVKALVVFNLGDQSGAGVMGDGLHHTAGLGQAGNKVAALVPFQPGNVAVLRAVRGAIGQRPVYGGQQAVAVDGLVAEASGPRNGLAVQWLKARLRDFCGLACCVVADADLVFLARHHARPCNQLGLGVGFSGVFKALLQLRRAGLAF